MGGIDLTDLQQRPSFDLRSRRIEVWCVELDLGENELATLGSTLSPDERDRAARFHFARHRDAFVAARGTLRLLLSRYLSRPAAEIVFEYGPQGKPSCADSGIDFNVSHSGRLALFAFTQPCEIGVDVEQIRPVPDMMDLANRFFCPQEAEEFAAMPAALREHAFFPWWTRKEACIKAGGGGLSTPLNSFRVSLQPGGPVDLAWFDGARMKERWTLHSLDVHAGYAAALAYRDDPRPLSLTPVLRPESLLAG